MELHQEIIQGLEQLSSLGDSFECMVDGTFSVLLLHSDESIFDGKGEKLVLEHP